jgi:hypothetical protein
MAPRQQTIAIPDDYDRPLWEKLPRESRQAFANFAHYRDLGPYRSVAKAAKDLNKSVGTLAAQSRTYRWVERTELYDDDLDARLRAEREGELMRAERQEAQLGRAMTTLAARKILGDPQNNVTAIDANTLDASEAAMLAEKGIRIRRLAMGQPRSRRSPRPSRTTHERAPLRDRLRLRSSLRDHPRPHHRGDLPVSIMDTTPLTWRCRFCSRVRPDEKTGVVSRDIILQSGVKMTENRVYCLDRERCVDEANAGRFGLQLPDDTRGEWGWAESFLALGLFFAVIVAIALVIHS